MLLAYQEIRLTLMDLYDELFLFTNRYKQTI